MKKYISSAENSLPITGQDLQKAYDYTMKAQDELWQKMLAVRKTDMDLSKRILKIWDTLDDMSDAISDLQKELG